MKIRKFRDLSLIDLNEENTLVIACDSTGAIGSKKYDQVKVDNRLIGYTSSMVALMEVLAFGARPVTVVNNLCVEMEPSGREILVGVRDALEELDEFNMEYLTGTTEENIESLQTGIGITVIGIKPRELSYRTEAGDLAVVLGLPKLGDEIREDMEEGLNEIMTVRKMVELRKKPYIKEILPVGSKGIAYEWAELCRTNSLDSEIIPDLMLNLGKSAGPASCSIVSLREEDFEKLEKDMDIPVTKIGRFFRR